MTDKQIRAALRSELITAGFVEEGARFAFRTSELRHTIEAHKDRRLTGFVHLLHHISTAGPGEGERALSLTEELASHGHGSPYPKLWSSSSIDATLVLEQVRAIVRAFQTHRDIAHFYSDRPSAHRDPVPVTLMAPGEVKSLSAAEASQALGHLAKKILGGYFSPAPRLGAQIWAGNDDVEGFRHCAYIEPNHTCTLGTIVHLSLSARDIARGVKHDDTMRKLLLAPRRTFHALGRPVLVPLSTPSQHDAAAITSALLEYLAQNPPNCLPR